MVSFKVVRKIERCDMYNSSIFLSSSVTDTSREKKENGGVKTAFSLLTIHGRSGWRKNSDRKSASGLIDRPANREISFAVKNPDGSCPKKKKSSFFLNGANCANTKKRSRKKKKNSEGDSEGLFIPLASFFEEEEEKKGSAEN